MPESEARSGCQKSRLGEGVGKRGLESVPESEVWVPESEARSGCRKASLEWVPASEAWHGCRKARLGVGAGKRGLEWVPESEAWSGCRKARLGVCHVAVTRSYYTRPSRLQGKGATDQECHHTGVRHKHFCVWLKPV